MKNNDSFSTLTVMNIALLALFLGIILGLKHQQSTKKPEITMPQENIMKETDDFLNDFYDKYYSYQKVGANFEQFKPFLSKEYALESEKIYQQYAKNLNVAQIGSSNFLNTQNYLHVIDKKHLVVISNIKRQIKTVGLSGKMEAGQKVNLTIKVDLIKVGKKSRFQVNKIINMEGQQYG